MTEEAASLWAMATNPYVVAAVIGANSLAISLSVLFSAGAYPQPFSRALTYFGGGKLVTACGFALIAMRGEAPSAAMIIAGNVLTLGGFSSNLLALWTLQGKPIRWWAPASIVGATALVGSWFTLVDPNMSGLRAGTSAVAFALAMMLAREMLFQFKGGGRAHVLGGSLAVAMCLVTLARTVSALRGEPLSMGELATDWGERVFFVISYVAATMSALNFAMISNDAFNSELRRMAASDPLTGLPNRRRLMERGDDEVRRAQRYHRQLAAVVIDLDHFKLINDAFGHAAGDAALKETARRCRGVLRDIDMLARLGGEEFVALLPETGPAEAAAAAERLRAAIADAGLPAMAPDRRLTASLGVASVRDGESFDFLLGRADEAMYHAKKAGRNCVWVADESASSVGPRALAVNS